MSPSPWQAKNHHSLFTYNALDQIIVAYKYVFSITLRPPINRGQYNRLEHESAALS